MATYKLVDDGYPNMKKIVSGKKWVGRVVPHAEGGYLGIMHGTGGASARGQTERHAFEAVVSQHMGFSSVDTLKAHNAAVKQQRSHQRAVARHVVDQAVNHGNWDPFMSILAKG